MYNNQMKKFNYAIEKTTFDLNVGFALECFQYIEFDLKCFYCLKKYGNLKRIKELKSLGHVINLIKKEKFLPLSKIDKLDREIRKNRNSVCHDFYQDIFISHTIKKIPYKKLYKEYNELINSLIDKILIPTNLKTQKLRIKTYRQTKRKN